MNDDTYTVYVCTLHRGSTVVAGNESKAAATALYKALEPKYRSHPTQELCLYRDGDELMLESTWKDRDPLTI